MKPNQAHTQNTTKPNLTKKTPKTPLAQTTKNLQVHIPEKWGVLLSKKQ